MLTTVIVCLLLVVLVRRWQENLPRQQLVLAEQPGILERLEIRQITQRVKPELQQEFFCRDVSVGRARRRAARTGCNQLGAAQMTDEIAADLLAEEGRKLGARDRLEVANAHQHLSILPVCPDQPSVGAMAEQRRQCAVARFWFERVEFAIRQARDAGFEGKSEQVHDGEDDVRRATTIDMKCCDVHAALVTEDAVQ